MAGDTTNPYYNHVSGQPTQLSRGTSAAIRAEFDAVQAAFSAMWVDLQAASAALDFGLVYQGSRATDPTTRYNGTPLQDGDMYFNTGEKALRGYNSGAWYSTPTMGSALLKSGGTLSGPLNGTTSTWSGVVTASGFTGSGAGLTGLTQTQINAALGYRPANSAGDTFTGTVNGINATFTGTLSGGTVTQTSDERKKKSWRRLPGDFLARLAGIKKAGLFSWKKGNVPGVGVGAQSLQAILPEAVYADENGALSVDYGAAAMVACVELAREVVALRRELEKRK